MKLVWKLLRQHISIPQFAGFFFANLIGMLIILLGIQFYGDVQSVFNGKDSFMKADYIIVNKKVSAMTTITGKSNAFSDSDVADIKKQKFTERVGQFTSSLFSVGASFDVKNMASFSTDMFFESVPDDYIDVPLDEWTFHPGDNMIPIILPKNYLDLYNFGYAQSRSLPKLSEGLLGAMKLNISVSGKGKADFYTGRIVGFSNRLNTILVPQKFMDWANSYYADGGKAEPTRLIIEVSNPTDEKLAGYLKEHNLETDADKLDASKTTYVLRIIVVIVMCIGLLISILSFYILMLSVYLLVQKNTAKLENLLLIGYSPAKVALPYQALTVGLNVAVFIMSFIILYAIRQIYIGFLIDMFPESELPAMWPAFIVGFILLVAVSALNVLAVRQKVLSVWKNRA